MKKITILIFFLAALNVFAAGKIQNENVKSYADIKSSVLTTTGNLSSISPCITSIGSLVGLTAGQFVYDFTTPARITVGTTITAIPGTCAAGQVQMSANANSTVSGDTITFGGQLSQLVNDSKIYIGANSLNETLNQAIVNGDIGGGGTTNRFFNNVSITSYPIALTDGYKNKNFPTLKMTGSSLQTITVPTNASVPFSFGDQVDILVDGAGTAKITPAGGVTINSVGGNRIIPQFSLASLIKTATDIWTLTGANLTSLINASCTNCTTTTSGNFKIFTYTTVGSATFVVSSGMGNVAAFLVPGGGGGGAGYGGGGGGGYPLYNATVGDYGPGTYNLTIPAGGAAAAQSGVVQATNGSNAIFDPTGANLIAVGGGAGAGGFAGGNVGGNGGDGGGGSGANSVSSTGGTGSGGGTNGGNGDTVNNSGGGGGGATVAGGNGVGTVAGNGGNGLTCPNSTMCGSNVFGGGGGGGGTGTGTPGTGGTGGGGAGVEHNGSAATGVAGTANTGGGGGCGSDNVTGGVGGVGGSGQIVLMVQYQ